MSNCQLLKNEKDVTHCTLCGTLYPNAPLTLKANCSKGMGDMRHRTMPDGSIVFPKRGNPPKHVEGYIQDEKDPYLFRPDFITCKHREKVCSKSRCGKLMIFYRCSKFCKTVTPMICDDCEVPEE